MSSAEDWPLQATKLGWPQEARTELSCASPVPGAAREGLPGSRPRPAPLSVRGWALRASLRLLSPTLLLFLTHLGLSVPPCLSVSLPSQLRAPSLGSSARTAGAAAGRCQRALGASLAPAPPPPPPGSQKPRCLCPASVSRHLCLTGPEAFPCLSFSGPVLGRMCPTSIPCPGVSVHFLQAPLHPGLLCLCVCVSARRPPDLSPCHPR